MLRPGIYIHAVSAVAAGITTDEAVLSHAASEPDYSAFIPPMQLRRMSKLVRMSIGAAHDCLLQVGRTQADAILFGTAFGCLTDTEVFLKKMVEQEEQLLTPTAFIQSTHNTPAGQIALATGCQGYNNTISQQGQSFASALMAAGLYLTEHREATLLCGAGDELSPSAHQLQQRLGIFCKEPQRPTDEPKQGMIAGEGVAFFLLCQNAEAALARIDGLAFFQESNPKRAQQKMQTIVAEEGGLLGTDLLLLGRMAGMNAAHFPEEWLQTGQNYRALLGAWPTDNAVALARAIDEWPDDKNRIWLLQQWGRDYSVILLERM